MPTLKLGPLLDDKPVRLTIELPAQVHRDLAAYAEVLGRETGQAVEPAKLIVPMLARFMATDRAFARHRRSDVRRSTAPRSNRAQQHGADRNESAR
jgi:hypothetical protein